MGSQVCDWCPERAWRTHCSSSQSTFYQPFPIGFLWWGCRRETLRGKGAIITPWLESWVQRTYQRKCCYLSRIWSIPVGGCDTGQGVWRHLDREMVADGQVGTMCCLLPHPHPKHRADGRKPTWEAPFLLLNWGVGGGVDKNFMRKDVK